MFKMGTRDENLNLLYTPEKSKCVLYIAEGPVAGYINKTNEGNYYIFKKIPYAEPPLGSLRFQPPYPVKPWTEELDCTQDSPQPLHMSLDNKLQGSEDCLYIDVSTPNLNPTKPMPVMFWIGIYGFTFSINNFLDPALLNDEDVIYVTCSFRTGPMGFLSINDFTAPGNCGFKDLVVALKWIQRNIGVFGGDPSNVTIFGNSSGGAIIHFMVLSPMTAGLFHKAIIQSTSALNPSSTTKNPIQPVLELAKELDIKTTCKLELIEELRARPATDIIKAVEKICRLKNESKFIFSSLFKPSIEEEFEGQPAFLTKNPFSLIKSGNYNKVPLIIGCNNIEESLLKYEEKGFFGNFKSFINDISQLIPKCLARQGELSKNIGSQILNFYLGGEYFNENTKRQYIQLIMDYFFLYHINKTVMLHSKNLPNHPPIYYYLINYAGYWDIPEFLKLLNTLGQSAETLFIFRIKISDSSICKGCRDSITTRKKVIKMWTNFSKHGNPTPYEDNPLLQITWDPVENENTVNYLNIGSELTKGRNPFYERMAFWDKLIKENVFLRTLIYLHDIGIQY